MTIRYVGKSRHRPRISIEPSILVGSRATWRRMSPPAVETTGHYFMRTNFSEGHYTKSTAEWARNIRPSTADKPTNKSVRDTHRTPTTVSASQRTIVLRRASIVVARRLEHSRSIKSSQQQRQGNTIKSLSACPPLAASTRISRRGGRPYAGPSQYPVVAVPSQCSVDWHNSGGRASTGN